MDLRTQQNDGAQNAVSWTAFICGCIVCIEHSGGDCAVGRPSSALRNLSDTQKRNCRCLVRPGAGAGLCFHHCAHRKDDYAGTPRCLAEHFVANGGVRVAGKGLGNSGYCHPSVRIWAVRSAGWMLRTNSCARAIQDRSRRPESALPDHRLAPWTRLNPKLRVAY